MAKGQRHGMGGERGAVRPGKAAAGWGPAPGKAAAAGPCGGGRGRAAAAGGRARTHQ
jgi:hypothetical protein